MAAAIKQSKRKVAAANRYSVVENWKSGKDFLRYAAAINRSTRVAAGQQVFGLE
jgi:hypothetical protein